MIFQYCQSIPVGLCLVFFLLSTTITPSLSDTEIRLANGHTEFEGRVEILHDGVWGTVCDDNVDMNVAEVLCRQLGFTGVITYFFGGHKFGRGEGPIWMDDLVCTGEEEGIHFCLFRPWGENDCTHKEDMGIECQISTLQNLASESLLDAEIPEKSVIDVKVQSFNGDLFQLSIGFLFFKHSDSFWYPICADSWDMIEGFVACGQLGFPGVRGVKGGRLSDSVNTEYVLKDVRCRGMESNLTACQFTVASNKTCYNDMYAMISCKRGPYVDISPDDWKEPGVRLKAGGVANRGRVEILNSNVWRPVCDLTWTHSIANVLCRSLGFGSARTIHGDAFYGMGIFDESIADIGCTGLEESISDCKIRAIGRIGCPHSRDAAVLCNAPESQHINKIRLAGGRYSHEGRVEVFVDGEWGTICSTPRWNMHAASVVCRQLGLGHAAQALRMATYYGGLDTEFVLNNVICSGDELSLQQCYSTAVNTRSCWRGNVAAVICMNELPDLVPHAELMERTTHLEDRNLMFLQCAHEENCLSQSVEDNDVDWVFGIRRLLRFTASVSNRGVEDFRPFVAKHQWDWHSCHRHYHSMDVFATYDLLDVITGLPVAQGHKASFCLEDAICEPDRRAKYACVGLQDQGISVGCFDVYEFNIDCQWIDITDILPGFYTLQMHVNPQRKVAETDYSNNIVRCELLYTFTYASAGNCHIVGDETR